MSLKELYEQHVGKENIIHVTDKVARDAVDLMHMLDLAEQLHLVAEATARDDGQFDVVLYTTVDRLNDFTQKLTGKTYKPEEWKAAEARHDERARHHVEAHHPEHSISDHAYAEIAGSSPKED